MTKGSANTFSRLVTSFAFGPQCPLFGETLRGTNYKVQWLQEGDVVEMEIDGLGKLSNTIVKDNNAFSILALKKV
jgi:hypothetical protein